MPRIRALVAATRRRHFDLTSTGNGKEIKATAKELGHEAEGKAKEAKADAQAKIGGA